jgi:hypothetical protein
LKMPSAITVGWMTKAMLLLIQDDEVNLDCNVTWTKCLTHFLALLDLEGDETLQMYLAILNSSISNQTSRLPHIGFSKLFVVEKRMLLRKCRIHVFPIGRVAKCYPSTTESCGHVNQQPRLTFGRHAFVLVVLHLLHSYNKRQPCHHTPSSLRESYLKYVRNVYDHAWSGRLRRISFQQ